MDNQIKILLSVQGIEGGTLRSLGKKRVKWNITKKDINPSYKGRDASKVVEKGSYMKEDFEVLPAYKSLKLTKEAYNYMTSTEMPWWFKGPWKLMTRKQRLEAHLHRIMEDNRGTSYTYSILED